MQVSPDSLEEDAKNHMKEVKAAGHKDVRWCDAYKVGIFLVSRGNFFMLPHASCAYLAYIMRHTLYMILQRDPMPGAVTSAVLSSKTFGNWFQSSLMLESLVCDVIYTAWWR